MTSTPKKGERRPLVYTHKARHRISCGLRWDARTDDPTLGERLKQRGGQVDTYDLDLMCVMYDAAGEFVDGVSGKPDESADDSGKVYHSGDDTEGAGGLDDEQIYVELLGLPGRIHHIVFVAEIQSAHTFDMVNDPEMRLADGFTDQEILRVSLKARDHGDKTAFVFARIYRDEDDWAVQYIGDFAYGSQIADWVDACKAYLRGRETGPI